MIERARARRACCSSRSRRSPRASSAGSASPSALLHDPEVLILDEPTDGLDPNQKHQVRTLLADMAKDKAIIISTHILEEVDALCTRAIVIAQRPDRRRRQARRARGALAATTTRSRCGCRASQVEPARAVVGAVAGRRPGRGERARRRRWPADRPAARSTPTSSTRSAARSRPPALEVDEVYVERGRLDEVFRQLTAGGLSPESGAMHATLTILRRELAAYFASPLAYVFIVIFLALAGGLDLLSRRLARARPGRPRRRSSAGTPGSICSWCRRSACGCGPRSARPARSSS